MLNHNVKKLACFEYSFNIGVLSHTDGVKQQISVLSKSPNPDTKTPTERYQLGKNLGGGIIKIYCVNF